MWSSLVNPGRSIPPEVSAIHHITDEMVKGAPTFADLTQFGTGPIFEEPDVDLFAAHNSRFEQSVWRAQSCLPKDEPVPGRWLDTYRSALWTWPDAPAHGNQVLRYWLGLKLADDPGPPHRSMGDAYVTAAILRRLLAYNSVETLLEVSNRPALLPRFTFGEHAMKPIADVPTSYLDWIVNKSRGSWDEDVLFTARTFLGERNARQKARSPV